MSHAPGEVGWRRPVCVGEVVSSARISTETHRLSLSGSSPPHPLCLFYSQRHGNGHSCFRNYFNFLHNKCTFAFSDREICLTQTESIFFYYRLDSHFFLGSEFTRPNFAVACQIYLNLEAPCTFDDHWSISLFLSFLGLRLFFPLSFRFCRFLFPFSLFTGLFFYFISGLFIPLRLPVSLFPLPPF